MAFVAGTPEVSTAINLKNDFQTDKDAEYFRNMIREILRVFCAAGAETIERQCREMSGISQ